MESGRSLEALRLAIAKAGSQAALARTIGVTQPTVSGWSKGRPLTAEHVLKVEEATGISRHDLRPDLYPREAPAAHGSTLADLAAAR